MKRADCIRHLRKEGCVFIREGAKHSVFFNPVTGRVSTVPRYKEIHERFRHSRTEVIL